MSAEALRQAEPTPTDDLWPDAQPLRREMPTAEPFPLDALPDVLGGAADAIRETVQAPDALIGQSLLAGAALAAQTYVDIEIDGRTCPASAYFVTVADSGERKSACDDLALAPHRKREHDMMVDWEPLRETFDQTLAAWNSANQEALKAKSFDAKRAKQAELPPKPTPPPFPMLTTSEPTYPGLVKALVNGWPSMGLFSDEGGQFLGGHAMNRDNRLATAAGLSDLWGGKPIRRTRVEDGQSLLYGRRVSLHLMVQPVVAPSVFADELLGGQGFNARILTAWPDSLIGYRPYNATSAKDDGRYRRYFAAMMALLETPAPIDETKRNALTPRVLTVAPDAAKRWRAFHDFIEAGMQPGQAFRPIKAWAAKSGEHALRLAGVITCMQSPMAGAITDDAMQRAIQLVQFYAAECLRVTNASADAPEIRHAEKALAWARENGPVIALVDLYQRGPSEIRSKQKALAALELLADHGHAKALDHPVEIDGKRRRDAWKVKP